MYEDFDWHVALISWSNLKSDNRICTSVCLLNPHYTLLPMSWRKLSNNVSCILSRDNVSQSGRLYQITCLPAMLYCVRREVCNADIQHQLSKIPLLVGSQMIKSNYRFTNVHLIYTLTELYDFFPKLTSWILHETFIRAPKAWLIPGLLKISPYSSDLLHPNIPCHDRRFNFGGVVIEFY